MLKFILPTMAMMIMKNKKMKMEMMFTVLVFNLSLQTQLIQKVSYNFMGDQLSFWNLNLAMWVMYILSYMKIKDMKTHSKMTTTVLLIFITIFYTWNFMSFFILFEMSMITMILMMMIWSYQPERVESVLFLIVMALTFSLPFMLTMMNNYKYLNFWFLKMSMSVWSYLSLIFIFLMKMPFFFIHFWLPKVHVEAPTQGSMILAAVMLKMGCYGMMRIMKVMKPFKTVNMMIIAASMWAMLIVSMTCLIQTDIKTLIAFSSVVHMMLVLTSILINKKKSLTGSMIIMVSHGLCASSLFFLSNIFYKNSKSRNIGSNKSITNIMPVLSTAWFITCMANTPMPPAISLLGEILVMKMIMTQNNSFLMIFSMALMSSIYSIYLFYTVAHGKLNKTTTLTHSTKIKTIMIVTLHMTPVIMMSVKPKMLMIM